MRLVTRILSNEVPSLLVGNLSGKGEIKKIKGATMTMTMTALEE
jgi:hypothetical protein